MQLTSIAHKNATNCYSRLIFPRSFWVPALRPQFFFLKRWPMTIFPFPIFIGGSIQIPRFPDDGSYPISNHVTSAQARENVEVLRRCQATHKSTINNMWWRVTLHEKMSMLIHTLHAVEILSQRWGRDLISLATPLRTFRDKT